MHCAQAALLSHGVLKEDLSGSALLTKANLDEENLLKLSRKVRAVCGPSLEAACGSCAPTAAIAIGTARQVCNIVGLPESTQFTGFHPAKLFDFSTRARCLAGFRLLGVRSGGATVRAAGFERSSALWPLSAASAHGRSPLHLSGGRGGGDGSRGAALSAAG